MRGAIMVLLSEKRSAKSSLEDALLGIAGYYFSHKIWDLDQEHL